ncbi:MAG: hypothetical protein ACR2OU_01625 [Thermomicrobiales bacterium]
MRRFKNERKTHSQPTVVPRVGPSLSRPVFAILLASLPFALVGAVLLATTNGIGDIVGAILLIWGGTGIARAILLTGGRS